MVSNDNKFRRSPLAQRRIDYIVFGNPSGVLRLVYECGFEAPKKLHELPGVVRSIIKEQGKEAVIKLINLHPDKAAILSVNQDPLPVPERSKGNIQPAEKCFNCGKEYDGYCGCNHSYDGYEKSEQTDLSQLALSALIARYDEISKEASADPSNKSIAAEATRLWNEIRQRNTTSGREDSRLSISIREAVFFITLTIIAAAMVGFSFRVLKESNKP